MSSRIRLDCATCGVLTRTIMVNLGIKRKDMGGCCEPAPAKDWDNEKVYPEIHASGKLAELMGAADLKEGDVVEVPVVLRVKRHSKTTENGKTSFVVDFCVERMGDFQDAESDEDEAEESADMPSLRSALDLD